MGKLCALRWAPCAPHPWGPLAKGPLQVVHFQPLATVQNDLSATPVAPTTCHSPTPGGRGGVFGEENLDWRRATGYRLRATIPAQPEGGLASAIRWT
jgi:hypothetical protein